MPRQKGTPKTGGRQAGTPNKRTVFLNQIFEAHQYDWQTEFLTALKNRDAQILSIYKELLPYLLSKMAPKEIPTSPVSPQESVENAQKAFDLLKQLENESNPGGQTEGN
jgi:hypothetical protein